MPFKLAPIELYIVETLGERRNPLTPRQLVARLRYVRDTNLEEWFVPILKKLVQWGALYEERGKFGRRSL